MADLTLPTTLAVPEWLATLPDSGALPEVLEQALNSPAHRERWKYTKPAPFVAATQHPMIDPQISGETQSDVVLRQSIDAPLAGFDLEQGPEAIARLCYADRVLTLDISASANEPIVINHAGNTRPMVIRVAAGVSLTLIENANAGDNAQQSIWIELAPNAQVQHSRNALDDAPSHWQYLNVRLQAGAHYQLNNHVTGCGSRRQDIHIIMDGQGAEATLVSAGKVDSKTALDQQVTLEHRQPRGQSKQTVHNIVANGGKCTFNGRIHIHEGAAGTNAQLSNKNLGMGEHATINTKPELEIYTDDVSCSHGATVGTISQDALFYLTSRGIDRTYAEGLLSQGFLRQCIDGPLADQALATLTGKAGEAA